MYFNNQMFNPQFVNPQYYQANAYQIQQYNNDQNKEVVNAVKAMHDLIKATKKLDEQHQQIAFYACLDEIAKEMKW
ncbi:MAG: hypothetical protein E7517_08855 [Ruminococcaceae bacterium]|nr:hypothetical protein [Oscillospiraceae bacterium]